MFTRTEYTLQIAYCGCIIAYYHTTNTNTLSDTVWMSVVDILHSCLLRELLCGGSCHSKKRAKSVLFKPHLSTSLSSCKVYVSLSIGVHNICLFFLNGIFPAGFLGGAVYSPSLSRPLAHTAPPGSPAPWPTLHLQSLQPPGPPCTSSLSVSG